MNYNGMLSRLLNVWRYVEKWPLLIFLLYFIFFGYFASSNPSLPESSCHFSPLHAWLPFRIQNGRHIQFFRVHATIARLRVFQLENTLGRSSKLELPWEIKISDRYYR